MQIFDFISDILYKKKGDLFNKKEVEAEFQPFMVQRWLSMYSNFNTRILNATTNKLYKAIDEKRSWYKLFLVTLPKSKFKRIKYIKKAAKKKGPKTDIDAAINLVAETQQISEREVREYVEEYGLDLSAIKKILKSKER